MRFVVYIIFAPLTSSSLVTAIPVLEAFYGGCICEYYPVLLVTQSHSHSVYGVRMPVPCLMGINAAVPLAFVLVVVSRMLVVGVVFEV